MLAVQHGAEKLSGNSFQLSLGSMLERHLANVAAEIELRIIFPTGKAETERRRHDALEIAGKQRQLRFEELETVFKPNFTFEDANAGHVERHALPFQMQEDRIAPGKAVTRLMVLHANSPIQLPAPLQSNRAFQFT